LQPVLQVSKQLLFIWNENRVVRRVVKQHPVEIL
jgi:hypothetical protein